MIRQSHAPETPSNGPGRADLGGIRVAAVPAPDALPDRDTRATLDRSLRQAHRTLLAVLAGCALVTVLQTRADPEPAPDPILTTIVVALALALIVARRASTSPVPGRRTRIWLLMASYACAAGIGILGCFLAITTGAVQTGLLYSLGAGILCLRPPRLFSGDAAPEGAGPGRSQAGS